MSCAMGFYLDDGLKCLPFYLDVSKEVARYS